MCALRRKLFTLSLDVIGELFSVAVALSEYIVYYFTGAYLNLRFQHYLNYTALFGPRRGLLLNKCSFIEQLIHIKTITAK